MTLEKIILKRPTQTIAPPKRLTLNPGQIMQLVNYDSVIEFFIISRNLSERICVLIFQYHVRNHFQ